MKAYEPNAFTIGQSYFTGWLNFRVVIEVANDDNN